MVFLSFGHGLVCICPIPNEWEGSASYDTKGPPGYNKKDTTLVGYFFFSFFCLHSYSIFFFSNKSMKITIISPTNSQRF